MMKKILRFIKLQQTKLIRIKDFPESVAIGVAWGVAVSFTPLLGMHLIMSICTWIMRGNIIAATVGTMVVTHGHSPFFFLDYKIEPQSILKKWSFMNLKLAFHK